jgi:hypothetical protein
MSRVRHQSLERLMNPFTVKGYDVGLEERAASDVTTDD